MSQVALEQRLWSALEPHVEALGYELLELSFAAEAGRRVLRLALDGPQGITLDQCAAASRALAPVLDEASDLQGAYVLEVSSPGINRPLVKPEHYQRFLGETVKIRLRDKQDGGNTISGVLRELRDGVLVIDTTVGPKMVPLERIARARLHRDVDAILRASRKAERADPAADDAAASRKSENADPAPDAAAASRRWKR